MKNLLDSWLLFFISSKSLFHFFWNDEDFLLKLYASVALLMSHINKEIGIHTYTSVRFAPPINLSWPNMSLSYLLGPLLWLI